jgi:hypothetical protein
MAHLPTDPSTEGAWILEQLTVVLIGVARRRKDNSFNPRGRRKPLTSLIHNRTPRGIIPHTGDLPPLSKSLTGRYLPVRAL